MMPISHEAVREAANDARTAARTLKGAANQVAEAMDKANPAADFMDDLAAGHAALQRLEREAKIAADALYVLATRLKVETSA